MKGKLGKAIKATLALLLFGIPLPLLADEPDISFTGEPVRYAFVDGDWEKFQAHHWMKNGYVGGVKDFSLDYENIAYKTSLEMEGHALVDENDYHGFVELKRKNWGYANFEYTEFRKYYAREGGVYHPFSTLRSPMLDRNLELDIGHLKVEAGLTLEELPEIVFLYERKFKDGVKSRLTWAAVREGAVTRNIAPSWQEIDEIVDIFAIRVGHEVAGFDLKTEQRWEFVRSELTREEKNLSTTSIASAKKIRDQTQEPEADLFTSTAGLERWFWNERALATFGYRFAHLDNREVENIFEMNENRALTNFPNPKQVRDARADNDFDSHTWVGSLMVTPWSWFNVITRFKSEIADRHGNSLYPQDTTPVAAGGATPDGIINTTEQSRNDQKITRWGEGISLRFTKIPRTAIYNDLEFEQIRNWLSEDRQSLPGQSPPNPNEIFSRETVTDVRRGTWTLGANISPWWFVNLTTQVRHRRNNNDYDDKRETDPGTNTARSAFINWQNIHTNEFTTRVTLRPWQWVQPAFRYQFLDQDYFSRFEGEGINVKTDWTSHTYTFDVTLQPHPKLLGTASFSRQTASTKTPARHAPIATTPTFNADVNMWLFSVDYIIRPELSVISTLTYSRTDNFNDFAAFGLPLGAEYSAIDLTVGLRWSPFKHFSIEPKYGFYDYEANNAVEFGNYRAHVIWLDLSFAWA